MWPDNLVVTESTGEAKSRKLYRLSCSPGVSYAVHDNCRDNLVRGVLERVFFVESPTGFAPPPVASRIRWLLLQQRVGAQVAERVGIINPITPEEFVATSRPHKRRVYRRAMDSLSREPVKFSDSFISGFGKCEKTNFTIKNDPAMRIVSPRSPRYNLAVGVFLRPLEHAVYHALDQMFFALPGAHRHPFTVAKGHNFATRGRILHEKWSRFSRPRGLLFDAKRFDQHVSDRALEFEHSVYNAIFSDLQLAELLEQQLVTRFFGRTLDGKVCFTKRGGRCSGDMNTALGNVLIMTSLFYLFLEELGVDFEFYDDGDDSVLIVEEEHVEQILARLPGWFLEFGFTMKIGEVAQCLEECEFCQTRPVFDGFRWTMVRDPRDSLAKDCCTTLPLQGQTIHTVHSYMSAVALCGEAVAGAIPVWNSFYSTLLQESRGATPGRFPELESGMAWNSRGMRRRFGLPTESARVSFWKAFGVQPAHQLLWESRLEQWSLGPKVHTFPYSALDPGYLIGVDSVQLW